MHKTPPPGTYLHTGNVYDCPGQAMVFDTQSSVYEDNLYCGERGGLPEEGFLFADPALRLPVMEELENCSYDGEIDGTCSFCATDWFTPLEGIGLYSGRKHRFRRGIRRWSGPAGIEPGRERP